MNKKRWDYNKTILALVFITVFQSGRAQNAIHDSISSGNIVKAINNKQTSSKNAYDKGYIGISSEISLQIGVTSLGYRINVDAGYKISKFFGIQGLFYEGSYNVNNYDGTGPYRMHPLIETETWTYRGFLAGPLFSIGFGENTKWYISPLIGHVWGYPEYYYSSRYSLVAYDLNTNLILRARHRFAVRLSSDFFINEEILTVNAGLGLIYRFKR